MNGLEGKTLEVILTVLSVTFLERMLQLIPVLSVSSWTLGVDWFSIGDRRCRFKAQAISDTESDIKVAEE